MANRLADEHSTYLRQHQDNPVDWYPWGAEAFAEAERRGVPVLLSVGYASCHWCHVMAEESFEDSDTAAQLNADFVAVKVDREQRPDIDAIYMTATQAMTGSGGWPMTCFLTPAGEPFFSGTYFPDEPRGGLPSFRQVLTAVTEAWRGDPTRVRAAGSRIAALLQSGMTAQPDRHLGPAALDDARDVALVDLDSVHGGFGGAPKFPPPMVLEFLLRNYERTGADAALDAVTWTLDSMARGGIYDQLAGGFSRYSVDAGWRVPHFEKMLTDNALLLRVYAHHARLTGSRLSRRIATETGDFMLREMRDGAGGFIASLDADAGAVEGATYLWTSDQIRAAAGTGDTAALSELAEVFGIGTDAMDGAAGPGAVTPNAGGAGQTLRLMREPEDRPAFDEIRARMLAVRAERPQPARDEIVTMRGVGLAVAALAEAGAVLDRTDWCTAADEAMDTFTEVCASADGWRGSMFHGVATAAPALLLDYAAFATGMLAVYQVTGRVAVLDRARDLLTDMSGRFRDAHGVWFDAPAERDGAPAGQQAAPAGQQGAPMGQQGAPMIARMRDMTDGAVPSGLAAAAEAWVTAASLDQSGPGRDYAREILASVGDIAVRHPRSAGWHLAIAEAVLAGPMQVAVAGPAGAPRDELVSMARRCAPGGAVIDVGDGEEPGRVLLAGRRGIRGVAAAYVCRDFACDRPTTDSAELARQLRTVSSG